MQNVIQFKLNNQPMELKVNGNANLLWVIRYLLQLTGTKYGCGTGDCGACTVLVNKEPIKACMAYIEDVEDKEVITIEGLAKGEDLHPMQKAFIEKDAMQCGFCTPGMIVNAIGLLNANPGLSPEELKKGMDQNLCRCGSYGRILAAISEASERMNG